MKVVQVEFHHRVRKKLNAVNAVTLISRTGGSFHGSWPLIAEHCPNLPHHSHAGEYVPEALEEEEGNMQKRVAGKTIFLTFDEGTRVKRKYLVVSARWVEDNLEWREQVIRF